MSDRELVLVTGGFGYVGGRLAQHLVRSGRDVALGTRHSAAVPDWLPTASVVRMSWDSDLELREACQGIDAVVHLAGMNARQSAADPIGALAVNGLGTGRLLNAAIIAGVRRFLYVSTAHVYGSPLAGIITEDAPLTGLHPYATSHRAGEDLVRFANEQKRIEGIVVRLSNSIGPPVHPAADCWGLLVNDLCRQAVERKALVLTTSGAQKRDFVALSDVCPALTHLLGMDFPTDRTALYNVGGGGAVTVLEMAARVAECCYSVFGYRPAISHVEAAPGEVAPNFEYRIGALLRTGYSSACDLDAEIVATLRFCSAWAGQMTGAK